jgi:S-adenosylmethionine decarboxylase
MMSYLGKHLICEYYGCAFDLLNHVALIQDGMHDAAVSAGATILEERFHSFKPQGVSGVVIIAESHLTIHTWPEYGYAAVDIFTCGQRINPLDAANFLNTYLGAENFSVESLNRGYFSHLEHSGLSHQPEMKRDRNGIC